jgi:hypothetical protein
MDLLELFRCQAPWIDTFDFTTKLDKLGCVSRSWKGEGSEFDGH